MSPSSKKVGGHIPPVPHQIAPMQITSNFVGILFVLKVTFGTFLPIHRCEF